MSSSSGTCCPATEPAFCMVRVIFCEHCGTILDEPTHSGTNIECHLCGTAVSSKGAYAALPCWRMARPPHRHTAGCAQSLKTWYCTRREPNVPSNLSQAKAAAGRSSSACARPCGSHAPSANTLSCSTIRCSCAQPTKGRQSSMSAPSAAIPFRQTHRYSRATWCNARFSHQECARHACVDTV